METVCRAFQAVTGAAHISASVIPPSALPHLSDGTDERLSTVAIDCEGSSGHNTGIDVAADRSERKLSDGSGDDVRPGGRWFRLSFSQFEVPTVHYNILSVGFEHTAGTHTYIYISYTFSSPTLPYPLPQPKPISLHTMSPHALSPFPGKAVDEIIVYLSNKFAVTSNGFLPKEAPLRELPPYYASWDTLIRRMPQLLKTGALREETRALDVLSTDELVTEAQWRRAYVILGFLAQAYIWGGCQPAEVNHRPCLYMSQQPGYLLLTQAHQGVTSRDISAIPPGLRAPRTPTGIDICGLQPLEFHLRGRGRLHRR